MHNNAETSSRRLAPPTFPRSVFPVPAALAITVLLVVIVVVVRGSAVRVCDRVSRPGCDGRPDPPLPLVHLRLLVRGLLAHNRREKLELLLKPLLVMHLLLPQELLLDQVLRGLLLDC